MTPDPAEDAAALALEGLLAGGGGDPDGLGSTAHLLRLFAASVRRHAAAAAPAGEPLPDPFPGEYAVRRKLGAGGFGTVWLADDLNLGHQVALKTLRVADPVRLAALRSEARLLAGLDHPNLIRVFAWRTVGSEHYLVMRYVAGGSLADRLHKEGPLPWQAAARYCADVGDALLAMHAAGLVHRDVKPANVLWDAGRDEAVLTDLGLSARLGAPGGAAGTPPYMSPEAFAGRVDPAGDTYALAATLFALAAGEPPFAAGHWGRLPAAVARGLPDPDPRLAAVPEAVERLVRAGLAADPAARPPLGAFVGQLRAALNHLLADALASAAGTGTGLRLGVQRWDGRAFAPVPAVRPSRPVVSRDLKAVPAAPVAVGLRTGDRVRVTVACDRPGWVTVFNVGPGGNLNLLRPAAPVAAGVPEGVLEAELTPPAGTERVFAVWTRGPQALDPAALRGLADADGGPSRAYRTTRDLQAIQRSVAGVPDAERAVAVLELDHQPP